MDVNIIYVPYNCFSLDIHLVTPVLCSLGCELVVWLFEQLPLYAL
jgi:hypothetical protein